MPALTWDGLQFPVSLDPRDFALLLDSLGTYTHVSHIPIIKHYENKFLGDWGGGSVVREHRLFFQKTQPHSQYHPQDSLQPSVTLVQGESDTRGGYQIPLVWYAAIYALI